MIKDEMQKRKVQDIPCLESRDAWKEHEQDQFHASLVAVKDIIMCQSEESGQVLLTSHKVLEQTNVKAVDGKP